MNERLRQVRKHFNLTLEEFGKRIGLSGGAVSSLELGKNTITEQTIKLVCKEFFISEEWLRLGSGAIFEESIDEFIERSSKQYNLDEVDIEILSTYMSFTPEERQSVKKLIFNVASKFELDYQNRINDYKDYFQKETEKEKNKQSYSEKKRNT